MLFSIKFIEDGDSGSNAGGGIFVNWAIAKFSRDFVSFVECRPSSSNLLSRDWRMCSYFIVLYFWWDNSEKFGDINYHEIIQASIQHPRTLIFNQHHTHTQSIATNQPKNCIEKSGLSVGLVIVQIEQTKNVTVNLLPFFDKKNDNNNNIFFC